MAHGDLESPEPERIHPRSDAPEGRSIQNSGFRIQNWIREQPGALGEAALPSILKILFILSKIQEQNGPGLSEAGYNGDVAPGGASIQNPVFRIQKGFDPHSEF